MNSDFGWLLEPVADQELSLPGQGSIREEREMLGTVAGGKSGRVRALSGEKVGLRKVPGSSLWLQCPCLQG